MTSKNTYFSFGLVFKSRLIYIFRLRTSTFAFLIVPTNYLMCSIISMTVKMWGNPGIMQSIFEILRQIWVKDAIKLNWGGRKEDEVNEYWVSENKWKHLRRFVYCWKFYLTYCQFLQSFLFILIRSCELLPIFFCSLDLLLYLVRDFWGFKRACLSTSFHLHTCYS